jgi:hypothetical protein
LEKIDRPKHLNKHDARALVVAASRAGWAFSGLDMRISATVPPGTPGRVRGSVWWSDRLNLFVFKGPTACYPRYPRARF